MGSTIWLIFTARRYVKRSICRRRVSAGFVLTIASRGPSAIVEILVTKCMRTDSEMKHTVALRASYATESRRQFPAENVTAIFHRSLLYNHKLYERLEIL